MPAETEPAGLAALLCLIESRRPARLDSRGELVLLEDQDRSLWDPLMVERGRAWLQRTLESDRGRGSYALQASIAAIHAAAASAADTDWATIVLLYESLASIRPTPVVALNHAAAVAMWQGADHGLELLKPLAESLAGYQPFHAAKGELGARAGRWHEAAQSLERAIELSANDVERRHLQRRLQAVRSMTL
jgi:RNA polymerase sigma-70 factor (ECF subfamily)